jgi:hypothetical protein
MFAENTAGVTGTSVISKIDDLSVTCAQETVLLCQKTTLQLQVLLLMRKWVMQLQGIGLKLTMSFTLSSQLAQQLNQTFY